MDNMGSSSSLPENLKVVLSFLYCQFMLRASENCLVAFELTLLLLIIKNIVLMYAAYKANKTGSWIM